RRPAEPPDPGLVPGQAEWTRSGDSDKSCELRSDRSTPQSRCSSHRQLGAVGRRVDERPPDGLDRYQLAIPGTRSQDRPRGYQGYRRQPVERPVQRQVPKWGAPSGKLVHLLLSEGYTPGQRRGTNGWFELVFLMVRGPPIRPPKAPLTRAKMSTLCGFSSI